MKEKVLHLFKKAPGVFLTLVGSVGLFIGMCLADLKHGGAGIAIFPAVLVVGLLASFYSRVLKKAAAGLG